MVRKIGRHTLTEVNFIGPAGADVDSVPGDWARIGEVDVPVQEKWAPGLGYSQDQSGAIGRILVDLQTAAVPVVGMVRLVASDASESIKERIVEEHTSVISLGVADPGLAVPFPEWHKLLRENSKLILEFMTDEAAPETITTDDSTIRIHVTRYSA